MKKKLGSVMMSIMLLAACETVDGNSINNLNLEGEGYHLLFFSNEEFIQLENNYYDVLLDLKKQFPDEMADLAIIPSTNKHEKLKKFKVTQYPTLIVIKNQEVLVRIEGKKSKKDIMNHLVKVIY